MNNKFFYVIFLSLFATSLSSFSQSIDKPTKLWQLISKKDTNAFNFALKVIDKYQYYKPDSAIWFIDTLAKFAQNLNRKDKLAFLLVKKAKIYYSMNLHTDATYFYALALQSYYEINDHYNYALCLVHLSKSLYFNIVDTNYPIKYLNQAIGIAHKHKFLNILVKSYNFKAYIYAHNNNLTLSKIFLDSAYYLSSKLNDYKLLTENYWYWGFYYQQLDDFYNSSVYFKKASTMTESQDFYLISYLSLFNLFIKKQEYSQSLIILNRIRDIAELNQNNLFLCYIYSKYADYYRSINQYYSAVEYTQKSLKLAKEINFSTQVVDNYRNLAELFSLIDNNRLAIQAYEKYISLLDKLNQSNKTKSNSILNQNLQVILKLKDQELLEAQRQFEQYKNKQQQITIYYLISIVILLATLFAIFFYFYQIRQKNEKYLRQITEATLEGLYIHDGYKILEVNDRMLEMTGYSRNELIGQPTKILLPEESQLMVEKKANMTKTVFYQFQLKRKDGTTFDVDLLSKPFKFKNIKAKVVSVRDVTQLKTIKKELTETKILHSTLVETSPDGVVILSLDNKILYASESFARLFDFPDKNMIINKNILEFFSLNYVEKIASDLEKIKDGQKIGSQQYLAVKKDKSEFYVECNGNYLRNKDNQIKSLFLIVRDINDRKQTEKILIETQNKFQTLFNKANDAIIIVDTISYKIIDYNPFAQIFFSNINELKEKTLLDLLNTNNIEQIIDNLQQEKAFETSIKATSDIFVHISVSKITLNKENVYMLIIRNISDLKNQQEQLRRSTIELKNALYTRERLFSIISHDLRGPIGNIDLMLKYISDNFDEFEPNEIKDLINALRNSSLQTFELTENLLNWAKTQQNLIKAHLNINNINEIILNTIDQVSFVAANKNINIVFDANNSYEVIADENLLHTAIRNILTNAIKFSYPNSQVDIKIIDIDEFWLKIEITDYGVGMSKEIIEKIFLYNQHYTTQGTNREKGSGLGLHIAIEYIKMNNGKLWVESEPNKGTTFFIMLKKA